MNDSQKRVTAALNHERPDRIPLFESYWSEFVVNWRKAKGFDEFVDIRDYYGTDIYIAVGDETPYYSQAAELERGHDYVITRDGWGMVKRIRHGGKFYEELEVAIKEKSDLDKKPFDPPTDDARYESRTEQVMREKEKRFVFCKTGGPYLRTAFLRGQQQFLMDIAADLPFVKELVARITDHLIAVGLEELRRWDLYSTGVAIYDDMACNRSLMFSPRTFEEVFYPALKRMCTAFKEGGAAYVLFHSDGNITDALDLLVDAGVDAINPVEPRAGMDLVALKERYGEKLTLTGGLCNSVILPNGSPEEITAHARAIAQAARDGGVIAGCHSVGPDIPVENYDLAIRVLHKAFLASR